MNRLKNLEQVSSPDKVWDVVIIGGGATGLGTAVEAVARGYSTLLLEQCDFAKATSSRSTKLAHGGVRYLQQGDVKMVLHALHERGLMARNAPHLVHTMEFIIPAYRWWEKAFYGIGLTVYDLLSGRLSLGRSRVLGLKKTLEGLPTVNPKNLRGGVLYTDGQFDDSRLAMALALTFDDLGGTALNYFPVKGLLKDNELVSGVIASDVETGKEYRIRARTVLNATGIFTDSVRRFDDAKASDMLSVSQGAHIVLDRSFLPGHQSLMIPHTEDGRVLFAVPWHQHVIVGTTDIPTPNIALEPKPMDEEIDFLLRNASFYLNRKVTKSDVLSIYAGQRPLVKAGHGEKTSALSRDHTVITSKSNLVTITGGKWTTYRRMGQDAVDHLAEVGNLPKRPSKTEKLHLHGYLEGASVDDPRSVYGCDYPKISRLAQDQPELSQLLHKALPYQAAEVVWAARFEMARTVEDVLSRRTRALLLDARASLQIAPEVARLLAQELGRDEAWQKDQVEKYREVSSIYILN
jgi:glycerol-3-phosphate dehydrogenase